MTRAVAHHGASRSSTGAVTATWPERRREIAHRRKQFFSLARSDPHRAGFVGQDSERRRRTQQSGEGEFPCRSPRLSRDDQPGRIRQQRFAADQARIGRQNFAQRLRDRRGRRGGECGVEAAGEFARTHLELEGGDLQGARSLRAQVLPGQVRQENEKETRGYRPRDARPRSRRLPEAKRSALRNRRRRRRPAVFAQANPRLARAYASCQIPNLSDIGGPATRPESPDKNLCPNLCPELNAMWTRQFSRARFARNPRYLRNWAQRGFKPESERERTRVKARTSFSSAGREPLPPRGRGASAADRVSGEMAPSWPLAWNIQRGVTPMSGADTEPRAPSSPLRHASLTLPHERGSAPAQARLRVTMSRTSADSSLCVGDARSAASALARRPGFERTPGAQRGQQARGDLRIGRIELQHDVGEQLVAGAVGAVELRLVGGEAADQRARRGWDWRARTRGGASARARARASRSRAICACSANHLSRISGSAA